jgi:hypothetical protein
MRVEHWRAQRVRMAMSAAGQRPKWHAIWRAKKIVEQAGSSPYPGRKTQLRMHAMTWPQSAIATLWDSAACHASPFNPTLLNNQHSHSCSMLLRLVQLPPKAATLGPLC